MENTELVDQSFWRDKRVFLTGHTGFKGSWLTIWLQSMGAKVIGYSLPAPSSPSLFSLGRVESIMEKSIMGNILDQTALSLALNKAEPDIVIHMAAQPLVRDSYDNPVETFQTNVIGTVNIFEAVRACKSVRAVLNVTTDKCYENQEWIWGYRENEALGGHDPYSSSKACSELVTTSYRSSFFHSSNTCVASARAGNVIGGGDWAKDRLLPDLFRSVSEGKVLEVRNPEAVRPWQHVLEPLSGYLLLCQKLFERGQEYSQAWNFGPKDSQAQSVESIMRYLVNQWPEVQLNYRIVRQEHKHEAAMLRLDSSKALNKLGWIPRWSVSKAVDLTVSWFLGYREGRDVKELCLEQINEYKYTESR